MKSDAEQIVGMMSAELFDNRSVVVEGRFPVFAQRTELILTAQEDRNLLLELTSDIGWSERLRVPASVLVFARLTSTLVELLGE